VSCFRRWNPCRPSGCVFSEMPLSWRYWSAESDGYLHIMNTQIHLNQHAHGHLVGSRTAAAPVREELEIALAQAGAEVILDFSGVSVTQSFIDELVGVLVLRSGPDVLSRIVFKGCSDDVRAIIEFVVSDRCDQYIKTNTH